jgi:hypothetical protein
MEVFRNTSKVGLLSPDKICPLGCGQNIPYAYTKVATHKQSSADKGKSFSLGGGGGGLLGANYYSRWKK